MFSEKLILVVGSSGAGKDSILNGARKILVDNSDFVFPRREVTRLPDKSSENHISVSQANFLSRQKDGIYALSWHVYGLYYGVPKTMDKNLRNGQLVIINVSRTIITKAKKVYPNLKVIRVTASSEILRDRLIKRRRENKKEVNYRLSRRVNEIPGGIDTWTLCNEGDLTEAISKFVKQLKKITLCSEKII